ncbi:hypothetical protein JCM11251_006281 [Rhodosporidiobolus azoricus]
MASHWDGPLAQYSSAVASVDTIVPTPLTLEALFPLLCRRTHPFAQPGMGAAATSVSSTVIEPSTLPASIARYPGMEETVVRLVLDKLRNAVGNEVWVEAMPGEFRDEVIRVLRVLWDGERTLPDQQKEGDAENGITSYLEWVFYHLLPLFLLLFGQDPHLYQESHIYVQHQAEKAKSFTDIRVALARRLLAIFEVKRGSALNGLYRHFADLPIFPGSVPFTEVEDYLTVLQSGQPTARMRHFASLLEKLETVASTEKARLLVHTKFSTWFIGIQVPADGSARFQTLYSDAISVTSASLPLILLSPLLLCPTELQPRQPPRLDPSRGPFLPISEALHPDAANVPARQDSSVIRALPTGEGSGPAGRSGRVSGSVQMADAVEDETVRSSYAPDSALRAEHAEVAKEAEVVADDQCRIGTEGSSGKEAKGVLQVFFKISLSLDSIDRFRLQTIAIQRGDGPDIDFSRILPSNLSRLDLSSSSRSLPGASFSTDCPSSDEEPRTPSPPQQPTFSPPKPAFTTPAFQPSSSSVTAPVTLPNSAPSATVVISPSRYLNRNTSLVFFGQVDKLSQPVVLKAARSGFEAEVEEEHAIYNAFLGEEAQPHVARCYGLFGGTTQRGTKRTVLILEYVGEMFEYEEDWAVLAALPMEKRRSFFSFVKRLHQSAKLIHNDIQPHNLTITAQNDIVLIDFASAKEHLRCDGQCWELKDLRLLLKLDGDGTTGVGMSDE